jgi:carbon monoxide dehydrogenase subunit G
MIMEGNFIVNVPINKVWDITLNVDTIAACIPGVVGETKVIAENTFGNVIVQRVAFLKVKFNTTTEIVLREAPTHIQFETNGKDTMVGTTMNVKSNVYFKELSPNETEVSYKAEVRVVGKLATFGEGIMQKKSKEIGAEVAKNLKAKLEG